MLKRSPSSLKDAAKNWNKLLFKNVQSIVVKEGAATPCVFVMKVLILAYYNDDLMVLADREEKLEALQTKITSRFNVKNLDISKNIYGLHFTGLQIMI